VAIKMMLYGLKFSLHEDGDTETIESFDEAEAKNTYLTTSLNLGLDM
jgi:hypothetical protein